MTTPILKGWPIRCRICPRPAWCARRGRSREVLRSGDAIERVPGQTPMAPARRGPRVPGMGSPAARIPSPGCDRARARAAAGRRRVDRRRQGASRQARTPRACPVRATATLLRQAGSAGGRFGARHRRMGRAPAPTSAPGSPRMVVSTSSIARRVASWPWRCWPTSARPPTAGSRTPGASSTSRRRRFWSCAKRSMPWATAMASSRSQARGRTTWPCCR